MLDCKMAETIAAIRASEDVHESPQSSFFICNYGLLLPLSSGIIRGIPRIGGGCFGGCSVEREYPQTAKSAVAALRGNSD